jgi:hypothetical protein
VVHEERGALRANSRLFDSAVPFGFAQGPTPLRMTEDCIAVAPIRRNDKIGGNVKGKIKGSGQECPLHTGHLRRTNSRLLDSGRNDKVEGRAAEGLSGAGFTGLGTFFSIAFDWVGA